MATQAQLEAEPWWDNELVPAALDGLEDRLCARYGVPRYNAGDKGNEYHLDGRHRSIEWSLNSVYCTDRSYGTVDSRDRRGNWRHIRAFDLSLPGTHLYPMCRRLDTAVRAGRLPKVAEWFGTFDGQTVVGWYEGHASSSDDSHLWHLHVGFWTENADDDHTDLYEILTGDDDMNLTDPVPSASTPDVPKRNVDQVLGDLWHGVHQRMGDQFKSLSDRLAAIEARPPVQSAPVDPAALAAAVANALSNPDVLAAVAKAVADENYRRQAS